MFLLKLGAVFFGFVFVVLFSYPITSCDFHLCIAGGTQFGSLLRLSWLWPGSFTVKLLPMPLLGKCFDISLLLLFLINTLRSYFDITIFYHLSHFSHSFKKLFLMLLNSYSVGCFSYHFFCIYWLTFHYMKKFFYCQLFIHLFLWCRIVWHFI